MLGVVYWKLSGYQVWCLTLNVIPLAFQLPIKEELVTLQQMVRFICSWVFQSRAQEYARWARCWKKMAAMWMWYIADFFPPTKGQHRERQFAIRKTLQGVKVRPSWNLRGKLAQLSLRLLYSRAGVIEPSTAALPSLSVNKTNIFMFVRLIGTKKPKKKLCHHTSKHFG